jgi:hypothetical protein
MSKKEFKLVKEWLDNPEHDIGFEPHKYEDCSPSKSFMVHSCERCAVELAVATYTTERLANEAPLNLELLKRIELVLGTIPCDECDHSLDLHFDIYGCERERPDVPGDESGVAYAPGPCCCKAENQSDDGSMTFALLREIREMRILAEDTLVNPYVEERTGNE